jgi:hypothetical protein
VDSISPHNAGQLSDCQRSFRCTCNRLLALVAVLPKHVIPDGDLSRPVLRVDHEDARWPDDNVVDIGVPTSGPSQVVQHRPSVTRKQRQGKRRGLLAFGSPLVEFGSAKKTLRLDSLSLRRLARGLTRHVALPRLELTLGAA